MINKNYLIAKLMIYFIIFSISIVSISSINSVTAANETVDPGITTSNINTMINSMDDGESLTFNQGTYNNLIIVVNKSISLKANGTVILAKTTGIGNGDAITIQKDNVNISGFNIINYNIGIGTYRAEYSNNLNLENNTISKCNLNGISLNTHYSNIINNTVEGNGLSGMGNGIRIVGSNNKLKNNNIINNEQNGILIDGNDTSIENNIIKHNKAGGIAFTGDNNIIEKNTINNNSDSGIAISSTVSKSYSIKNNVIINNKNGIALLGTRHIIENNNIVENKAHGIDIRSGSTNNNIANNNITKNNGSGIYLGSTTTNYNIITKNNITKNNQSGIFLGGSNNLIESNTIKSNNIGITLYIRGTWINNKINYNRIVNNTKQLEEERYAVAIRDNNANFNWWGVNELNNSYFINGLSITNNFIISFTNTTPLNNLGIDYNVGLSYIFRLNTSDNYELEKLSDFNTTITGNNSYYIEIPAPSQKNLEYIVPYLGIINITATCDQESISIVFNADKVKSNTTININNISDVIYGDTINFIVKLTDDNNDPITQKTIEIWLNGVNIKNGTTDNQGIAIIPYVVDIIGDINQVEVKFPGDLDYEKSENISNIFKISKSPTNIKIAIEGITEFNEIVNFIGTLTSPNGPLSNQLVEFWLNGINIGNIFTDNQGKSILSYLLNEGRNNNILEVIFRGNSYYEQSKDSIRFNIAKKPTNVDLYIEGNLETGQEVKIVATLTSDNLPLKNQNITFIINGIRYSAETDQNGIAILNYKFLKSGINFIIIEYLGNNNYNRTNAYLTVNISANQPIENSSAFLRLISTNQIKTLINKNIQINYTLITNNNINSNITIKIPIPAGLTYVSSIISKGTIEFNTKTNILTWKINDFKSKDDYSNGIENLIIILKPKTKGIYIIKPSLQSSIAIKMENKGKTSIYIYDKNMSNENSTQEDSKAEEKEKNKNNTSNILTKAKMKNTGIPMTLISLLLGVFCMILYKKEF